MSQERRERQVAIDMIDAEIAKTVQQMVEIHKAEINRLIAERDAAKEAFLDEHRQRLAFLHELEGEKKRSEALLDDNSIAWKEVERLNTKCANLEGHNEKLHALANTAVKEQEYAKRKAIEYNKLSVDQAEEIERLRATLTDAREDLFIVASAGYHEAMIKEAEEAATRIEAVLKGVE